MQAQLIVADRLSSVGTLAAGIAHEVNNPLSYVLSNLELMAEEVRRLSAGATSGRFRELEELTGEAWQGAERVRRIIRSLKTFCRVEDNCLVPVDVKTVLESSINMTFNVIRHRARLVKELHPVPEVQADEARLGQVFINLLVNAAHAIPEGDVERNQIVLRTMAADSGQVVVEVCDTGSGIPDNVMGRIFDPFFTTKPIGEGTGLGLSICHGIIASFGGSIEVDTELGKGTTFRVVLPPRAGSVQVVKARSFPAPASVPRGKVLIVDDDVLVGSSLRRVLGREHEVTVLTSAKAALDLLVSGEHFDVILCDLMMPEMTGMDLFSALSRTIPEMCDRMAFITGGAFTATARAFLESVPNPRLEKPLDLRGLRALVRGYVRTDRSRGSVRPSRPLDAAAP
jgi:CheY-like chemotaxis protein/two-component sensor histidine kinase